MSWQSLLKGVAPVIGGLVGGPLGSAALTAAAQALLPEEEVHKAGGNVGKLERLVEGALNTASPEQLAELKRADQAFETRMAELGIDLEKIHAADRDSARKRQVETGDKTPAVLAYLYTIGFFCLLAVLIFYGGKIDTKVSAMLQVLLGVFLAMLKSAADYFFGSSAGSAKKNVLLAEARK